MLLEEDWTEIEVFADRLQAAGDPRGELLALELASERATNSEEARRLNREAQRIRDAHHELVWPAVMKPTQAYMRAGFVVSVTHDAITKHALPLELLLSLRDISVQQPLERCAALLEEGWRRGLRLEGLGHWGNHEDGPTQLGSLRRFIEYDAQAPALEWVSFSRPVRDVELLTKLPKLRSCSFRAPLSEAELRSLAPLQLGHLTLHGQPVPANLGEWFGDTLTELRLSGCEGRLTPLSGLSQLAELTLEGEVMADAVANLQGLTQLEYLTLPRLDGAGLDTLAQLSLRSLTIGEMSAALAQRLPSLQTLESLTILRLEGCLDVSMLAELPRLRRLFVPGALFGELRLPPDFQRLALSRTIGAVPITGEVAELTVIDCDLNEVSSSLLESVRDLRVVWFDDAHYDALAELPRLVPQLERFSMGNYRDDWAWPEAPEILGALPRLRALDLEDETVEALAERARMFPDLCVLGDDWPRGCGLVP